MPAGIQIFNNSGYLQIDDNYRNYTMTGSFAGTTNRNFPGGTVVDYAIGKNQEPMPICAVRNISGGPAVFPHCLSYYSPDPTIWKFPMHVVGAIGSHAECFFFDRPVLNNGTGLFQVYGPDGKLSFDSDFMYLRVIEQITVPYGQTVTRSYPGRRAACAISVPGVWFNYFGFGGGGSSTRISSAMTFRQDPNGDCTFSWVQYFSEPWPGGGAPNGRNAQCCIIDVTHYPTYYDYLGYTDPGHTI